jgi:uncharacterized protein (DUF2141 family)
MSGSVMPGILSFSMMSAGAAAAAPVTVEIAGVRSSLGQVRVNVCVEREFLKDPCSKSGYAPARSGSVRVTVPDVPAGSYAVQVYHDENGDGKLARGFMGIPKEGFALSNGAKPRFGPPRWKDAVVELGSAPKTVRVSLNY